MLFFNGTVAQECLLNGRLEPMSTVEGFGAELGASGSFCPSHELLPVSVFFYNIGGFESDKSGSPYLAHLNLGAKGYKIINRIGRYWLKQLFDDYLQIPST